MGLVKFAIAAGVLILLISAYSIFFTFDNLIKITASCAGEMSMDCNFKELGFTIVFSLLSISIFLVIDVLAVYLIAKVFRRVRGGYAAQKKLISL